jgi:hypothetical protein
VAAFERANAATPRPAFDYNIARCYDRLGRWKEALQFYERYLASPDAKQDPTADETRARVAELRARIGAVEPAPPTSPTPPPPIATPIAPAPSPAREAPSGRGKKIAGATITAVGGALLIGGIVCGVLAQQASDDISAAARTHDFYNAQRYAAGRNDQIAEAALLAVGGAALVGGVVVLALGVRDAHHRRSAEASR